MRPERSTLLRLLLIGLFGALGGTSRVVVGEAAIVGLGWSAPLATATTNIAGGLLIGLVHALTLPEGRWPLAEPLRTGVLVGFLGSFTTFSLLSAETFDLLIAGETVAATLNLFGSLSLAIVAAGLGLAIGQRGSNRSA